MPLYALGAAAPRIHPSCFVHPDAVLIGEVVLGPRSSVWPGAVLRADFGPITVGARSSVQDGTVVHTTQEWETSIGQDCVVGHNAHIEGSVVEDRVLVASGAILLNATRIGTGSVVAAGALVTERTVVPPWHVAAGVPARSRPADRRARDAWIDFAVGEYLKLVGRYRADLRRVELSQTWTDHHSNEHSWSEGNDGTS